MNAQSTPGPVDFDLSRGRVERRADPRGKGADAEPVVLVPLSTLAELDSIAGGDVARRFARTIGVTLGKRVASGLGGAGGSGAALDAFVSALAAEIAVSGWGALHLERWGRAMILVVENAPALPPGAFAALLEGTVEAATGREVHAVALPGSAAGGSSARVLIVSRATAERVHAWLAQGTGEAEVLRRLHDAPRAEGGAS